MKSLTRIYISGKRAASEGAGLNVSGPAKGGKGREGLQAAKDTNNSVMTACDMTHMVWLNNRPGQIKYTLFLFFTYLITYSRGQKNGMQVLVVEGIVIIPSLHPSSYPRSGTHHHWRRSRR